MYAVRISSSIATRRTFPTRSISMLAYLNLRPPAPVRNVAPMSQMSLPPRPANRNASLSPHPGTNPVPVLERRLLRRRGAQVSTGALGHQATIGSADLACHVVDPAPPTGDPAADVQLLARCSGRAETHAHLGRHRPRVEA